MPLLHLQPMFAITNIDNDPLARMARFPELRQSVLEVFKPPVYGSGCCAPLIGAGHAAALLGPSSLLEHG